jgi:hypothetical protein
LSPQDLEGLLLNTTPRKQTYLRDKDIYNCRRSPKRLRVDRSIAASFKTGLQKLKIANGKAKQKFLRAIARKSANASKVKAELNISFRSWQKFSMVSEECTLMNLYSRKKEQTA